MSQNECFVASHVRSRPDSAVELTDRDLERVCAGKDTGAGGDVGGGIARAVGKSAGRGATRHIA